jgi:hypothetical protein
MKYENDLKMKAKRSLFAKWAYTPHFAKRLLFAFIFVVTFCRCFKLRSPLAATPRCQSQQRPAATATTNNTTCNHYHHHNTTPKTVTTRYHEIYNPQRHP